MKWFVLESFAINDIDYTASETLRKLIAMLKEKHVRFVLTDVIPEVQRELEASNLLDELGPDAVHPSMVETVAAYDAEYPPADDRPQEPPLQGAEN